VGGLARRFGTKQVYLAGLAANLLSMVLLIVSSFFTSDQPVAYGLLLAATACLGVGFGLTAPALNTFTAVFHPAAVDRSVLVLNALLGLGTALAPVFVAIFVGLGLWVGAPGAVGGPAQPAARREPADAAACRGARAG
jgi:MFS family permease